MKENQGIALGHHYPTQQLPKPLPGLHSFFKHNMSQGRQRPSFRGAQGRPTLSYALCTGAIYPKKTEEESPGGST